jgi:hypothetical protein
MRIKPGYVNDESDKTGSAASGSPAHTGEWRLAHLSSAAGLTHGQAKAQATFPGRWWAVAAVRRPAEA